MKKSLVVVTVLFAVVAFASAVLAAGPTSCAPAPMQCKKWTETKKLPAPQPIGPKPGGMTKPRCVTVPCKQVVTIPGKVAYGPTPAGKWVPVKGKVYNILCAGKAKGACPVCGGKVTWAAKWSTLAECGTVKYKIFYPPGAMGTKKMRILVKEKVVPVAPKCAF